MLKWLVIILFFAVFAGCKKSDDVATSVDKQAVIDDQKIANYISTNKLTTAVHVGTPKVDTVGVWYVIEDPGTIPVLYTSSSSITVNYTGKILGSTQVFANSSNSAGVNPAYVLGQTIKGWQLGIQGSKINKGGKLRIIMASRYAYGPYKQDSYGLPANSILDFEINIFDVTN